MDSMSNILHIDRKYELVICMSWIPSGGHGMSGHIFELIEYYMVLNPKIKSCILICEDLTHATLREICESKYDFSPSEVEDIVRNTIISRNPAVVRGRNMLLVDGNMTRSLIRYGVKLIFRNIFALRCSPKDTFWNVPYKNVKLLQDQRVYNCRDSSHAIDYKKKLLLSRYKKIPQPHTNEKVGMLYLTSNCRSLEPSYVRSIIETSGLDRYIILTNDPARYRSETIGLPVTFPSMPVDDLFSMFDTYIYTKTDAKLNPDCGCFDCSPRFIVECKHYNKNVIYRDIDSDYMSTDTGLKYRRIDIENDYDSILLEQDDEIVHIIKSIIN